MVTPTDSPTRSPKTKRKSFRGYVAKHPPEFDLESPDGRNVLTVHCKLSVPGFVLLDFLAQADSENPGTLAAVINNLLQACVNEDEWDDVMAFTRDPANGIDIQTLAEIAGYLSEVYGARNPQSPAPSRGS